MLGTTKNYEGKSIILGAPPQYGFADVIERELTFQGFRVYNLSFVQHDFSYKHLGERLSCYLHKNFLGQKDYKNHLRFKRAEDQIMAGIAAIPHADYALFIRPDQYSEEAIRLVRGKVDRLVGYQWDGLSRYPEVYKRIELFDRFFVFDPNDASYPDRCLATNFYTNSIDMGRDEAYRSDVCYLGSYQKGRAPHVEQIIHNLQQLGLTVNYRICRSGGRKTLFKQLNTTGNKLTYAENLRFAYNTRILVDVPTDIHNGLSFRVFEAIGFDKKLITTNREIANYDFYHPDNIFIWEGQPVDELRRFVDKPYAGLAPYIKEQYSFEHWIAGLLGARQPESVVLPVADSELALAF